MVNLMMKRLVYLCVSASFAALVILFSFLFIQPAFAQDAPAPKMVGIPGTHQDELGCSGDWQSDCKKTLLTYDAEDDVWQGVFEITPANDGDKNGPRYKAALNGTWTVNYGKNASLGGADIALVVSAPTKVKFYYDNKTHWVTDNFNTPIIVATGNFQTQLGCNKGNDAGCLRSWLEDPDGDGVFSFTSRALKAGDYTVTLAKNEDATQALADTRSFTVKKDGDEIYFGYDTVNNEFIISTTGAPKGSLSKQKAHWVSRDTILWDIPGSPKYTYSLFYSLEGTLVSAPDGITGGTEVPLEFSPAGADSISKAKFPHLATFTALKMAKADLPIINDILKGQVAVMARDADGKILDTTGVQIPGVLDDLYSYTVPPLGVSFTGAIPTLRLWAPTARSVTLNLFADSTTTTSEKLPMAWDIATGAWSVVGKEDWAGKYYLFEVEVYMSSTGKIEKNIVTDPYSISLSTNSLRSQIVDLSNPALKPQGWDALSKPALAAPEDSVIYELHVRDFSISDQSVPENLRGTYKAFTVSDSDGIKHLKALAAAGLTHIHLLPVFDIASINEDKSTWKTVDEAELAKFPPNSDMQSLVVKSISASDGFNWGYDPYHFTTPEGSYATDPNGTPRIVEFRQMVQALNQSGLRVVMDVVYNHTNASGLDEKSVLDKVVPGYYHRLDNEGKLERSTCCSNTATEHNMMRKLMIDSLLTWAKEYKVDGFRFDLMGHHMLADMKAVRAALNSLTLEKDGVDGKSIYVYGEGWDFGEVANNTRGVNATQLNIGGTGIGVFNDRLRDAVRGGGPFGDIREQGFASGLYFEPNAAEQRDLSQQNSKLLETTDWIRATLAGNLQNYEMIRADGYKVPARQVIYNGKPAAYTLDPQENIVYVSAHDNETLWDILQVKIASSVNLSDRVRMNNLALSLVAFSQGVPFFHAGDDLLRSKSLDRNSYNSGDWFNKLDWTYNSNNWGVGLPSQGQDKWDIFRPLLANPALKPGKGEISFAAAVFRDFLQIRKSSPLFRLQTAEAVQKSVSFFNTGPNQTPGLVVMQLSDVLDIDPVYNDIVVLFNASPLPVTFSDSSFTGLQFELHPVQAASTDEIVQRSDFDTAKGAFSVPGRTTAVFVLRGAPALAPTLSATATDLPTGTAAVPAAMITPAAPATPVPTHAAPITAPAADQPGLTFMSLLAATAALVGTALYFLRKRTD
jgi:pullulanase-type alpha-1,6-glucosidase